MQGGHSSQLPYMGSACIADIKHCKHPPLSPAFLDWRGMFGADSTFGRRQAVMSSRDVAL